MKRREFITLLGGATAAWPLTARAQQPDRMRRIGVLVGAQRPDDPESQANFAAFLRGLRHLGRDESRNVQIDYRWGLGNADNVRKYAMELAALAPDVILASGTSTMTPLLQVTRTLPIVFVNVADPVGAGFVDSLSRPGGNSTGFLQFEYRVRWAATPTRHLAATRRPRASHCHAQPRPTRLGELAAHRR
jgi:putative ABC transport system substrate-binding protein